MYIALFAPPLPYGKFERIVTELGEIEDFVYDDSLDIRAIVFDGENLGRTKAHRAKNLADLMTEQAASTGYVLNSRKPVNLVEAELSF